jgi:hypothetical protein
VEPWRLRQRRVAIESSGDFILGLTARQLSPATFFTINAVLAKLDQQRGRDLARCGLRPDAVQYRD